MGAEGEASSCRSHQAGGVCDSDNLLARMVPGMGALVLAGCLSPRWGLLATNWPHYPPVQPARGLHSLGASA